MFGLLTPKHQKRVNDVYPTHPGEEGASSSKLSRLTYYINANPLKLKKVFAYLESKVKNDLGKQRTGYNKVSLEIIDTLIEQCSNHIRLFATNSLRIIYILVVNGEEELATRATASFNHLLACSDSQALSLDQDFRKVLESLIEKYTSMCKFETGDLSIERDYRLIGMSALRSIFMWEDFREFNQSYKIEEITIALLNNMKDSQSLHSLVPSRSRDRSPTTYSSGKRNSFYDEVVTDEGLDKLAVTCLELLIKKASTSYMTSILSSIFKFLDDHLWTPNGLALNIVKLVVYSAQSQTLFLVVSNVFRILDSPNFTSNYAIKATMIDILKLVLSSNRSPLGISATELLGYLMKHLRKSVRRESTETNPENIAMEKHFQESLTITIESILSHKDYSSQKFDVIVYVVMRVSSSISNNFNSGISVSPSEDGSANPPPMTPDEILRYRSLSMKIVAAFAKKQTLDKDTVLAFPYKLIEKLLRLAMDPESDVRLNAITAIKDLCIQDLSLLADNGESPQSPGAKKVAGEDKVMADAIIMKFRYCVMKSILMPQNEPRHFTALFNLLVAVGNITSVQEVARNISYMLAIQRLAQEEVYRTGCHRFIQMLVLSFIIFASRRLEAKVAVHYLQQILQERKNDNQWYTQVDFYSEDGLVGQSISELESSGQWKSVDIFVTLEELKRLYNEANITSELISIVEKPYDGEVENLEADKIFTRSFGPKYDITRKNSIDITSSGSPVAVNPSSSPIGVKEMKDVLSKGKKSEATKNLMKNFEIPRKSMMEFQSSSASQLNLRMEKEAELKNLLDEGEEDSNNFDEAQINVEIDRILLKVDEASSVADATEKDTVEKVENEIIDKIIENSDQVSVEDKVTMKVSKSRELFSETCVLNMNVPDPLN